MEVKPGQIVFSKCGHDQGLAFLVVRLENDYVFLADGKNRRLEKPKKKKRKHIQPTKAVVAEIAEALLANRELLDADVRKAIKAYMESKEAAN